MTKYVMESKSQLSRFEESPTSNNLCLLHRHIDKANLPRGRLSELVLDITFVHRNCIKHSLMEIT